MGSGALIIKIHIWPYTALANSKYSSLTLLNASFNFNEEDEPGGGDSKYS